jgi:hypothetical protein
VVFKLNKPVKSAVLVGKDGSQIPLMLRTAAPAAALRDFPMSKSQAYELRLTDNDGRNNKVPAQLTIDVVPNRRPELKFAAPRGDQRLSPIEEVAFRAEAWDDFGLIRYGLTVNVAGHGEQELVLGNDGGVDETTRPFAPAQARRTRRQAGRTPLVFLWAEDVGADGKSRRTASDMFFWRSASIRGNLSSR